MNRSDHAAIQRGIELAPFTGWHHGANGQIHGRNHLRNAHRVGREHFAQQRDCGLALARLARCGHRAGHDFMAGVTQHGAGQHVLGFGMRGHAKTGHVDADHAHAVDGRRQQLQRHTAGGGHAQVDDDDGVEFGRVSLRMHGFADVFKQLAGDQRLGVEGHVAHAAASAVKMRGEGQAVDAAGRAGKDSGGAPHAQTHAQRAEGRAHALRLVVRAFGVVSGVLVEHFAFAGRGSGFEQHVFAGVAAQAVHSRCGLHSLNWNDGDGACHGVLRFQAAS